MKHKRITVVSLLCMFLLAFSLTGFWAFSRVSDLEASAQQIAKVEESGTSLSLTVYGDPEGARQALEMFQYLEAHNIEYGTSTTDPNGNPINAALEISEVEFSRTPDGDDDFYTAAGAGSVKGLDVHVDIGDMLNVDVEANEVEFGIEFWRLDNGLPAFNITAELTGNVYVSLSIAFLPLPGLQQAIYEFSGDYFVISVCVIKPIEVTMLSPSEGERISGHTLIQAEVKTAPGISVGQAGWWADRKPEKPEDQGDHFDGELNYNETTGKWEGVWRTHSGGNGWYGLGVRVEGVQTGASFSTWVQDMCGVEVNNPWVEAWLRHPDGSEEPLHGEIVIEVEADGNIWQMNVWFGMSPQWVGVSLTAPEYWRDGNIQFEKWEIPGTPWGSGDPRLTLTQDVIDMLFDGEGRARALRCIYVETSPP